MKLVKFPLLLALACIPFAGFAGTASAAAPSVDKYCAAAKAKGETKLTIYNPVGALFNTPNGVNATFQKHCPGVTVSFIPLAGLPMRARIKAEKAAGKVGADIANAAVTDLGPLAKSNVLVPFTPALKLPKYAVGLNKQWTSYLLTVGGAVFNTNQVQGGSIPDTYNKLVDPKWKGKTASSDLKLLNSGTFIYIAELYMLHKIDKAWLQKVKANNPTVYPSTGAIVNAVANGQQAITLVQGVANAFPLRDKGAPIGVKFFKNGSPSAPIACGILNGAPNPNLAKAYCTFLLTKEGQQKLADVNFVPIWKAKPAPAYGKVGKILTLTARQWQYDMPKAIKTVQSILSK